MALTGILTWWLQWSSPCQSSRALPERGIIHSSKDSMTKSRKQEQSILPRATWKDQALWPLTYLGFRDDREMRLIQEMRKTQYQKVQKWDFKNLSRFERLQLINECSKALYLRKQTKATNRLSLLALAIAAGTGILGYHNLQQARLANSLKNSPGSMRVTSIPPVRIFAEAPSRPQKTPN